MVDELENEDSLNLEGEAIVPDEGTTPDEENGGQPEPVNLAKLKVEDLETMDEARKLEAAKLLLEANRKLYARVTKPKETKVQPTNSRDEVPSWGKELQIAERKRQFGYEYGLSPDETDAIFRINPRPNKNTLEDPFVKGGLEAIRAKKRVENAIPNTSGRTATFNGKSLQEMDTTEASKSYADVIKNAVQNRRK